MINDIVTSLKSVVPTVYDRKVSQNMVVPSIVLRIAAADIRREFADYFRINLTVNAMYVSVDLYEGEKLPIITNMLRALEKVPLAAGGYELSTDCKMINNSDDFGVQASYSYRVKEEQIKDVYMQQLLYIAKSKEL